MNRYAKLSRRAAVTMAATALTIAGCAAPPPAPIIGRTAPGTQPMRPVLPPVAAPAPAVPSAATLPPVQAPEAPGAGVQTAPIRSGAIESRGIDGRPLAPPGAVPGAAVGTAPGVAVGTAPGAAVGPVPGTPPGAAAEAPATVPPGTRTQPLGTKVPYSEAAVAQTRAADAAAPRPAEAPQGTAPAAVPPIAAAPTAPPAAAAPVVPSMGDGGSGGWMWPAPGRMIQTFEQSANRGIALDGQVGEPVLAASDGRVIFSGNGPRGYGNLVIVKHDNDLLSVYAHNRVLSVKEGQTVRRGQKIAEIGDSGTTSARLHFEIRQQGRPVDPMKFLPRR